MNEAKFTGKAGVYSKYRSAYPAALPDWLCSRAGLGPGDRVADIGAGTGILSRLLLEKGLRVFAVEPNDDMRAVAEKALGGHDVFCSIKAAAEATGLPSAGLDCVCAARAFHWFDTERFKAECQRILRPDGMVALIWSKREGGSLREAVRELNRRFCMSFTGFHGDFTERSEESFKDFFRGGEFQSASFAHSDSLSEAEFAGRLLSSSYAPRPEDANYAPYLAGAGELFRQYSTDGHILMPESAWISLGKV